MSKHGLVDITLVHVRDLERSVIFKETPTSESFVLPKSQIEVEETKKVGIVVVTMPEWLAQEKELI